MYPSLVGECAEAGDVVIAISKISFAPTREGLMDSQWHRNLHRFRHQILDLSEHW